MGRKLTYYPWRKQYIVKEIEKYMYVCMYVSACVCVCVCGHFYCLVWFRFMAYQPINKLDLALNNL